MGKRGPKPTPTAILKLRGSTLVSKRRESDEVQGPEGDPEQPDWLDDVAKAAWDQLVPLLETMGVLTRIDGNALTRYCRMWSRWCQAEKFIQEKGEMYPLRDEKGGVKYFQQWPQVSIANKLAQQLTKLEAEFGMTPSSRARLQIPNNEDVLPRTDKSRFFRD
jgi:P27 family predicted phage terminase small subunit